MSFPSKISETFPADKFEVAVSTPKTIALIVAIAGAIILALAIYAMATQPYGSGAYWAGSAGIALGIALEMTAGLHFYLSRLQNSNRASEHQNRTFSHVKDIEQYKTLLNQDTGAHYTFRLSGYIDKYERENAEKGANLSYQIGRDSTGMLYLVDGQNIESQHIQTKFGKWSTLATQSAAADLQALLRERYECHPDKSDFPIAYMGDRYDSRSGEFNTRMNLITKNNQPVFLEITHLSAIKTSIEDEPKKILKYIKSCLLIDLVSRDAVATWSSPQDA